MFGALAPARAHLLRMSGVRKKRFYGNGELNRITVRNQVAGYSVFNDFGCAAMGAADDRFAARHCFEIDKPEALASAGEGENLASGITRSKFRVAQSAQIMHMAVNSVFFRKIFEPGAGIARSREDEL